MRGLSPIVLLLLCSFLTGCPTDINRPECFPDVPNCTIPFFDGATFLRQRCALSGCHGDDIPETRMDLLTADTFERLASEDPTAERCSADAPRINLMDWRESYLLHRVNDACSGRSPMPPPGDFAALTDEELSCLERWVATGVLEPSLPEGCERETNTAPATDTGVDAGTDAATDAGTDASSDDASSEAGL